MRRLLTVFFRRLLAIFFSRIEVIGAENIPDAAPVIFAVNHPNGLVDPLFIIGFVPRRVSFLAKAPLFTMPFIGYFVRTLESVPVYRKQDNTAGTNAETFARARQILATGGAIAIFPEGQITRNGLTGPFYRGLEVMIAGRDQVPVIPVYLDNLWDFAEADLEAFREEARITYLHELGHYLGWDEDEVSRRGLE